MIGQDNLKNIVNDLIEKGFPRFTIITGAKGQGKKTLANYIVTRLKYPCIISGIKIDELRTIIETSYKQAEPIIYIIPDADKMSIGAKNSLLKVIEEPPNNAYFIMTLQSIENTLPTIKSRCQELKMENYTDKEINKFIELINYNLSSVEKCIIEDICHNYYEIDLLNKYGVNDFYKYVEKVVDNIYKVQSANSFKLTEKLDLKNDDTKYDLKIFFETYRSICMNRLINIVDDEEQADLFKKYGNSISKTSEYINKLSITGISKQSLVDMWILSIRKIWLNS